MPSQYGPRIHIFIFVNFGLLLRKVIKFQAKGMTFRVFFPAVKGYSKGLSFSVTFVGFDRIVKQICGNEMARWVSCKYLRSLRSLEKNSD